MKYIKKYAIYISAAVSFLIFIILLCISNHMTASLLTQNASSRWSKDGGFAQISCFFSVNSSVSKDSIEEFEHSLDDVLKEESITLESITGRDSQDINESARLWADAYSADGRINISSTKTSIDASAIGIGGDFFLFHPIKLLEGSYFSGNDVMHDYCVLDEDAAWQLFGSNDIAGQIVTIAGVPHIVTGVIERPEGRLKKAAGLTETVVYVSYETLEAYGINNGINHYEIVMPNPVRDYALGKVKDKLGNDEENVEIIENDSRFSIINRVKTILAFGTRSMNGKAIIYPYWENEARGYEDIIALMTIFMFVFLLYPIGFVIVLFVRWWKHKGWTVKEVIKKCRDRAERFVEVQREKKKSKKADNVEEDFI